MLNLRFKIFYSNPQKGSLLLELLIAISILGIVLGISSQAVYVSLQSGKVSSERDVATNLANGGLESLRPIKNEDWQNLYNLTKATQHYHVEILNNKFIVMPGDTQFTLGGITYTRYFIVQNVCRETNPATRNVTGITDTNGAADTCATSGGEFAPSTQKVSVTVSWANADPVTVSQYFFRWKNQVCVQTNWASGTTTPVDSVNPCSTDMYFSDDNNINNTTIPGSVELK